MEGKSNIQEKCPSLKKNMTRRMVLDVMVGYQVLNLDEMLLENEVVSRFD